MLTLLDVLQCSGLGLHTGNVYCGAPTVADDFFYLFLARSLVDLHAILSVQGYNASLERYIISDTNTKVIIFNSAADIDFWNTNKAFSMNGI